jgi:mannitol/fructose-specific phosphotransferase system IIA component (Ntr-type)
MKFNDFIVPAAIRPVAEATDKKGIIEEMVKSLAESGAIPAEDLDSIVKAILKREELGSTGIGRGIAVPHTKHPSVDKLVGAVAVSPEGVEFDALDGDKVRVFFFLVSPPDRPSEHLRALENVSRRLRNDKFLRFLTQSTTSEDILTLLEEADNDQFND